MRSFFYQSAFAWGTLGLLAMGSAGCWVTPKSEPGARGGAAGTAISGALIGTAPVPPRELQRQGMSFADRFALEWDRASDLLAGPGRDPSQRVAVLAWRIHQTSQVMDIAAGPDPRSNLLDLVVFLEAGEYALQENLVEGMPTVARDYLIPMYSRLRAEADSMAAEVLLPEQQENLRALIAVWLQGRPTLPELTGARLLEMPGVDVEDFADFRRATGLWSSVRRWLGQVNTSLLFGERVVFLAERTPRILSQQTDLTLAQIAQDFPLATWKPDFEEVGEWVEELPERFGRGWSATYGEMDWESRSGEIEDLWKESQLVARSSREFLQAATGLSLALQTSLEDVQVWWREEKGEEDWSPAAVRVLLAQAGESLARLDDTIAGVNSLLESTGDVEWEPLQAAAMGAADGVIDRAFQRALLLLLVAFAGLALLLVFARWLFPPAGRNTPSTTHEKS